MRAHRLMLFSVAVLATSSAAGCGCISSQQVVAKEKELRSQNRAGAEPGMFAAAKIRGAVLLPLEPQGIPRRLPCVEGTDEAARLSEEAPHDTCDWVEIRTPGCQEWASDGRSFLIHNKGKSTKLAIPIRPVDGSVYARLAQRDNKLIVLLPRLAHHTEVGTVTECECDGMPSVQCPSTLGFVIDTVPAALEIEEVWVPMTEDYLRKVCKTTAL